jgi:hypothetical protein
VRPGYRAPSEIARTISADLGPYLLRGRQRSVRRLPRALLIRGPAHLSFLPGAHGSFHGLADGAILAGVLDAPTRVLVVAYRMAPTPALLMTVRERALEGPVEFVLLVPGGEGGVRQVERATDIEHTPVRAILRLALPGIRAAARGHVEAYVGGPDPVGAVSDIVNSQSIDEIIVSAPAPRVTRWMRMDLARRLEHLGLPVTNVVTPPGALSPAAS